MKKTFRQAMLSTICMLVVAVISLTGVTYAWFTQGEAATVSGMEMKVTSASGGIEIRLGNSGSWGTTLDLGVTQNSVSPVSSADGETFYAASINPKNTNQIASTLIDLEGTNSPSNPKDSIIIRDIQLQNTGMKAVTVNLVGSVIEATTGVSGNNNIYKAARVAIISGNTTYIWNGYDDTYFGISGASEGAFFNVSEASAYTSSKAMTADEDCLITLPAAVVGENDVVTTTPVDVRIVVWLEGQDADCKNSNAGGAFKVTLTFKDKDAE